MEPAKFKKNDKGNWVLNDEWKEHTKKKPAKAKKGVVTEDNHVYKWKEIVTHLDTGRAILFCACMSGPQEPFRGCGAAAIRSGRSAAIKEVIKPRWE